MHSTLPVAVVSVIMKNNKILLLRRENTSWMDWYWWLPWWRLDIWESMTIWAIRELKEEIWIEIEESNILFESLIQHKDERWERIYFVIYFNDFKNDPTNIEKDKCSWLE